MGCAHSKALPPPVSTDGQHFPVVPTTPSKLSNIDVEQFSDVVTVPSKQRNIDVEIEIASPTESWVERETDGTLRHGPKHQSSPDVDDIELDIRQPARLKCAQSHATLPLASVGFAAAPSTVGCAAMDDVDVGSSPGRSRAESMPDQNFVKAALQGRRMVPRSAIGFTELISLGSSGKVFKGMMQTAKASLEADSRRLAEVPVAAKRFFRPRLLRKPNEQSIFLAEIELLARLQHPNIVKFMGVVFEHPFYWIVTEYEGRYNLEQRLRRTTGKLSCFEIGSVAIDIARALEFLHDKQGERPVVHRDIKPGNVLLRSNGQAVLADFGYAVTLPRDGKLTTRLGSPAYVAPEVLFGREYNETVDIYAFGILMWEMLFREEPYRNLTDNLNSLMQYICMGGRLDTPPADDSRARHNVLVREGVYGKYVSAMESCWEQVPGDRLSAGVLLKQLMGLFANVSPVPLPQSYELTGEVDPTFALHQSLCSADTFEAGLALISGASLNEKTPDGWNALHEVIATGNMEMMRFVLNWNGSELIDVGNTTETLNMDIFELARYVSSKNAIRVFSELRSSSNSSPALTNPTSLRRKLQLQMVVETLAIRMAMFHAMQLWKRIAKGLK